MLRWGWLWASLAVAAEPQSLFAATLLPETPWHEDDPACLLQWRDFEGRTFEGFACRESSALDGYHLYYRKAATADLNLSALAEQRSEALCAGREFFWLDVQEDWLPLPEPTENTTQTLVQFAVTLRCGVAGP